MLTYLEELLFNIILYQSKKGVNNFTSTELSRLHPDLNKGYLQYLLSRLETKKYLTWINHKTAGRTFTCLNTEYSREHSGTIPPFACITKNSADSSISVAKESTKQELKLQETLRIAAIGEQTTLIQQVEEQWKNIRLDSLTNEELNFLSDVLSSMTISPQDLLKEKLESLDFSSLSEEQVSALLQLI